MFSDPLKNLRAFGLRDDAIVADVGTGMGQYSIPAGKIASRGKVYAIDLHKDFLMNIKNKAIEAGLNNVEYLWGNAEKIGGTKLADGIVDAVIASNVLFQVEDRDTFIEEIKRILKPKGRVLLIDWSESPAVKTKHVISKDKARALCEKKGLVVEREIDAGAHHYGIILSKLES